MRRAASLIALVLVLAGCSSEPPAEAERGKGRFVVDTAHDSPEVQDATLDAFDESLKGAADRPLAVVDATVDGGQVVYVLTPSAAATNSDFFMLDVDASSEPGWAGPRERRYAFPAGRAVITRATPDAAKLAPGASNARTATKAVAVLCDGQVVFDSAKARPIQPAAERYLTVK